MPGFSCSTVHVSPPLPYLVHSRLKLAKAQPKIPLRQGKALMIGDGHDNSLQQNRLAPESHLS